jgi:oligoribonuclease NrnB/cAMP/cGMP phosphodiesterase (DHH superfamily)
MRIVTRPDFDGVVCAVLLYEVHPIDDPILWTQPNEMQRNNVKIQAGDIIANLPYHSKCTFWFDHHISNQIDRPFNGSFQMLPSAASVVYDHYQNRIGSKFKELVDAANKIDSADLTLEEIQRPENHPYILLSMTIFGRIESEKKYWNHLVSLLRRHGIDRVLSDPQVDNRCHMVIEDNKAYKRYLQKHTTCIDQISITDFRKLNPVPDGNRFIVYSLFPDTIANVKLYFDGDKTVVKIGHSIINRGCNVNAGKLMAKFNGGGHRGAGACRFDKSLTEEYLPKIIKVLKENHKND